MATRPKKEKVELDPEDELAALRKEVASLKDRMATLLTDNQRLKQRLANAGLDDE